MKVFMIGTALLLWALSQSQAAAEPSLPPSTVALVVAYADGRVNYELTSAIRRRFTTRQPTRDG